MFSRISMQRPETIQTSQRLSLKLSEVLEDLGVHDTVVKMRRKTYLVRESLATHYINLEEGNKRMYHFGSQSEGTTTPGLHSDLDSLLCSQEVNIIQTNHDWKPGMVNFLVVQDSSTSPGYCLLQEIKRDNAIPTHDIPDSVLVKDAKGRVLHKNSFMRADAAQGQEIHGPAVMSKGIPAIETDDEGVYAYHCKTWPHESRDWVFSIENCCWPTKELIKRSEDTGFFVVPVASKLGEMKDLEWRLSTSLAERILMFSLNITQIQCYVLLKMIMKSFVHPVTGESISSFICKTTLFHCINKSYSDMWNREHLVECLLFCLDMMREYVNAGNCPHFMSHRNNLLSGRYSNETKRVLTETLGQLLQNIERFLLEIPTDDLGRKLQIKLNAVENSIQTFSAPTSFSVAGGLLKQFGTFVCCIGNMIDIDIGKTADDSTNVVRKLFVMLRYFGKTTAESAEDKMAEDILYSIFMGKLACSLAILNEDQGVGASLTELFNLSFLYRADLASNQLKFASIFYSIGDFTSSASILGRIIKSFHFTQVTSTCGCIRRKSSPEVIGLNFMTTAFEQREVDIKEVIKTNVSFCIRFVNTEEWAVPLELRHDFFKLIYEDMWKGKKDILFRKTWAVVDSLTFLFFMQYKTYGKIGRRDQQELALHNLEQATYKEDNLGHRETALNLLGQCMEEEGRLYDALYCYWCSLRLCPKKNAAKVLICCSLAKMFKML